METDVKLILSTLLLLLSAGRAFASCTSGNWTGDDTMNGNKNDDPQDTAIQERVAGYVIGCCGVVDHWKAKIDGAAATPGDLYFQVWRFTSGTSYELVGQDHFAVDTNGPDIDFSPGTKISVQPKDIWGWYSPTGPYIPYKDTGGGRTNDNYRYTGIGSVSVDEIKNWNTALDTDNRDYSARVYLEPGNSPSFTNIPGAVTIDNSAVDGDFVINIGVTDQDTLDIPLLVTTLVTATTEFRFNMTTRRLEVATLTTNNGAIPLTFNVSDPCGNFDTKVLVVTIHNPPPVIHNVPAAAYVSEDAINEEFLFLINVTDAGDTYTCTVDASFPTDKFVQRFGASSYYEISSNANPGFNYTDINEYTLTTTCNDTGGSVVTGTYIVYLIQNQTPWIINLQNYTRINTSWEFGATIFTCIGFDNEGDNLDYYMTCDPSPCVFEIKAWGDILLTTDLTNSNVVAYDLYIVVTDGRHNATFRTLTVIIEDLNDPCFISNLPLSGAIAVRENAPFGDVVYDVFFSDGDVGQAHFWTMTSSPNIGTLYLSIDTDGVITTAGSNLDYEALVALSATSFTLTVDVTDLVTSDTQVLVVDVIDVNEPPSFPQASFGLSTTEGAGGTILGTVSFNVTDPDAGDSYTVVMDCGPYASYFSLNPVTGQVRYQMHYDRDGTGLPDTVTCNVTATDTGGLTDTATLDILVSLINEHSPLFIPRSYTFLASYYSNVGDVVGTTTAIDYDDGIHGNLTFTINQQAVLGVDQFTVGSDGVIRFLIAPMDPSSAVNYSMSYSFIVTAEDIDGWSDTATVVIVIQGLSTIGPITTTNRYKKFLEHPLNFAWFVICMIVLVFIFCFTVWLAWTCRGEKGMIAFLRNLKLCWNGKPAPPTRVRDISVRDHPPPVEKQTWRNYITASPPRTRAEITEREPYSASPYSASPR